MITGTLQIIKISRICCLQYEIRSMSGGTNFFKWCRDSVQSKLKEKEDEFHDHYQSWADFNNRGNFKSEYMNCWLINAYGKYSKTLSKEIITTPAAKVWSYYSELSRHLQQVRRPTDILVKVHAASINPIDLQICEGYASNILNVQRTSLLNSIFTQTKVKSNDHEFPLVLGRDFSGTVIDHGMEVYDIKIGDEVFGTPGVHQQGTLADYHCTSLSGIAIKPASLSHVEAAALPYVGTVVLTGLHSVLPTIRGKRALVLGGTGGVGTTAIQILKAHGAHVAVTCSEGSFNLCIELGATDCFNYTSDTVIEEIRSQAKFDVIFDTVGAADPSWAAPLLVQNGTYISMKSSVAQNTDKWGVVLGLSTSAMNFLEDKKLGSKLGINIIYPLFRQNREYLGEIAKLVNNGLLKPVIHDVKQFDDVKSAFDIVASGHAKGKVVVNVSGSLEATEKPKIEKVIHL